MSDRLAGRRPRLADMGLAAGAALPGLVAAAMPCHRPGWFAPIALRTRKYGAMPLDHALSEHEVGRHSLLRGGVLPAERLNHDRVSIDGAGLRAGGVVHNETNRRCRQPRAPAASFWRPGASGSRRGAKNHISGAIDMCGSAAANPESGAAPRFGWVCRSQGSFETPSPPPQKAYYAVVLFDGFTPLIATWLVSVTGNPLARAFYVMTDPRDRRSYHEGTPEHAARLTR